MVFQPFEHTQTMTITVLMNDKGKGDAYHKERDSGCQGENNEKSEAHAAGEMEGKRSLSRSKFGKYFLNASCEFIWTERFGNIVLCTQLKTLKDLVLFTLRCNEENGYVLR